MRIAAQLVNADGGVDGRPIHLDQLDLDGQDQAQAVVDQLRSQGVVAVLGAYSSPLSMAASAAAARDHLVYWEAGAVADQVTGRGLPDVFRVGATGTDLGTTTARFVAAQLLSRLRLRAAQVRVWLVTANDDYAHSVANAARSTLTDEGMRVVSESVYEPFQPRWAPVLAQIRQARPDLLVLSSHIPDGISFRRAFLAAGLKVKAFLGSTMAQCLPNFGDQLGAQAVGVFASDRPEGGFNPHALGPSVAAIYTRLATAWRSAGAGAVPSEEGLAGFSAAWALFHDVLPRARHLSPAGMAAAAWTMNLPQGSLPNGAGLRFSTALATLGQNLRASAVVWQWQAVRHSVVVWPPAYATGTPVVAASAG